MNALITLSSFTASNNNGEKIFRSWIIFGGINGGSSVSSSFVTSRRGAASSSDGAVALANDYVSSVYFSSGNILSNQF